jgi:hypothetical protein
MGERSVGVNGFRYEGNHPSLNSSALLLKLHNIKRSRNAVGMMKSYLLQAGCMLEKR